MPEKHIIYGPKPIEPWPELSIGELLFEKLTNNEVPHEAMIDALTEKTIFYKELLEQTCKIAIALQRCGIKQNDVISVCSENSLYFFQPVIAALYLGAVTMPLSFLYKPGELLHSLRLTKPKILFCSRANLPNVLIVKNQAPFLEKIVLLDQTENLAETESLQQFINVNCDENNVNNFRPLSNIDVNEQVAIIMSSSGTTGLPKGVMHTHKSASYRFTQLQDERVEYQLENKTVLALAPMFHHMGFVTTLGHIISLQRIIILPNFNERTFLATIEKYRIGSLKIVPTLAFFLLRSPLVDQYDLSLVKRIIIGSSLFKKEHEIALEKRFKGTAVHQGYGATEMGAAVLFASINEIRHGSVGKVLPYACAKIIDRNSGKSLGPNEQGELCFKGMMVMKGYYQNEEATANTIDKDGWLHTGDLAHYDVDGYFYIIDRIKELIKYKSYQVAPSEIEELLLNHPKIQDAGVVGIPDEEAGELPLALIVQRPNSHLSKEEVQEFVSERLSPHKQLRGGVVFVNSLPRSGLGKLLRQKLRQMIENNKSKL